MKEIELIEKRKPREKHFLQENGEIIAKIYGEDIHYLKDGRYEEIDNTLIQDENGFSNKSNSYKVHFNKEIKNSIMRMESNGHFIDIKLKKTQNSLLKKLKQFSKFTDEVKYENVQENIDLDYKVLSNKVKESIVLKNKNNVPQKLSFYIDTDLTLTLDNNSIYATDNNEIHFKIEEPFMIDSNNLENHNIYYELKKYIMGYELDLILDLDWLNSDEITYPVYIDPTITNSSDENNVYDTYIYPGDTNVNRNNSDILKAGVERVNGQDIINRTLVKFGLPIIGTGSQIVDAKLRLIGYHDTTNTHIQEIMEVRRITSDWNEETANWSNMNDKYDDTRIDGSFLAFRSTVTNDIVNPCECLVDVTELVKRWYTDLPNYGIMIKLNNEVYDKDIIPAFYSKNNNFTDFNPKPLALITYRNQNGIEQYMKYIKALYKNGTSNINTYNGNLTNVFDIVSILGKKNKIALSLVYNTNDVILGNDYGYGIGWKFNLHKMVKPEIIDEVKYIKYIDEDGTIHYFKKKDESSDNNIYIDEINPDLTVIENQDNYLICDKDDNKMKFVKVNNSEYSYLSEVIALDETIFSLNYDINCRIKKITSNNDTYITLNYFDNKITVTTNEKNIDVNYVSNKIMSLVDSDEVITFSYDNLNLINSVIDKDGKKINFEYYDVSPYKVKKISEFGSDNSEGRSLSLYYKFSSTTIVNNDNKITTFTFDKFGSISSITNLKNSSDLNDAIGGYESYGTLENNKNKQIAKSTPLKYVKNYLPNSSFEKDNIIFSKSSAVSMSISDECSVSGTKSLKVSNGIEEESITTTIAVEKGRNYTFSAYVKNDNKLLMSLAYLNSNRENCEVFSNEIKNNDDFTRYDVSIYYPEDATTNLILKFNLMTVGTTFIDNIQLEDGETSNKFNYLENSDFSNDFNSWNRIGDQSQYEIVELINNKKALKIKMDQSKTTSISQGININGKKGDKYTLAFWYKNEGLYTEATGVGDLIFNNVSVAFNYTDELGRCLLLSKPLIPNADEWQYFTATFTAQSDYSSIDVDFLQIMNANNLYITNIGLYNEVKTEKYSYDENGKLLQFTNINDESNYYKYSKENQLTQIKSPNNNEYTFEYDNNIHDRILSGISYGISNSKKYDSFGNVITEFIKPVGILNNGIYRIRLKGTNKYLNNSTLKFVDNCFNHNIWNLEKNGDFYKIRNAYIENMYLAVVNNAIVQSKIITEQSLFEIVASDNGSYFIKLQNSELYLKNNNNVLELSELILYDCNFEFYIEKLCNDKFVETSTEYDDNGNFVKSKTDSLFNKTYYKTNVSSGLITEITDAKKNKLIYEYNDGLISSISQNQKKINIEYLNGMLKDLIVGNKTYHISYDGFSNVKTIKVNNVKLLENNYNSKNGALISTTFGNNHNISYGYDEFNRISSIIKMDKTYNYIYNSSGLLSKVKSLNGEKKYYFDDANRVINYINNNFEVKCYYDKSNNIIKKIHGLDSEVNVISKVYNNDCNITDESFGDNKITYIYDEVGRIESKKINNKLLCNYEYIGNGKRTSAMVKKVTYSNGTYSYKYDKLLNITHIYNDNKLIKKFTYDDYNQLIRVDDYKDLETIRYNYDLYGNILSKKVCKLNTFDVISQHKFTYDDSSWKDKLTKYDNQLITYDEVGNPLTIGSNILLSWINGKELSTYTIGDKTINFAYDENGYRILKKVNNNDIVYYNDGNKIIYEKNGNNIIYYIYSENNGIIGFKYNQNTYLYLKNIQGDIIGIMDENLNIVANYQYDSYGKIVSITDASGNDVSTNENHIANINPFRYRGYYYDRETGLYYLGSRYYNPDWGRFINADHFFTISSNNLSTNLFIFALNNPINYYDENGYLFKKIKQKLNKMWNDLKETVTNVVNNAKDCINALIGFDVTVPGKKDYSTIYDNAGIKVSEVKSSNYTKSTSDSLIKVGFTVGTSTEISLSVGDIISTSLSGGTDKSISFGIGKWNLTLGIDSITNKTYIEYLNQKEADGVDVGTGLRIETNPIIALVVVTSIICIGSTLPAIAPAIPAVAPYIYAIA